MTTSEPWWRDAVVYQVYPRSFADESGDGEGDLAGVISRLPYLASLGVDAIWLSPSYPSPQLDAGYDVSDPRAVDPRFGTLEDAQRMINEAHARGLRVIVDLVPNHFSTAHEWFQEALASPPGSPERARFHFREGRGPNGDEPPNNWASLFTGPSWTRVTEADGLPGQWYMNMFDSSQADLNWTNPDVVEDFHTTLRFWLDMGVDGFRVDVAFGLAKDMTYPDVPDPVGLVEGVRLDLDTGSEESQRRRDLVAGSPYMDRDEVQDIYRGWRAILDSYEGDRMAVAEAWLPPARARRYVAGDTLHQIFNFDFLMAPWDAGALARVITSTIDGLAPAPVTWALNNHDTARVATRLGGGDVGVRRARALAMLAHALPGSLYIFQGEELGLQDAEIPNERREDPVFFRSKGEQLGRDGARAPLPWSGDAPPYGFGGQHTWLPQPDGWGGLTVAAQQDDPASTLALYRASILLRRAHPGLAGDAPWRITTDRDDVIVLERGAGFVCVSNCSAGPIPAPDGMVLLSSAPLLADGSIPPDTTAWFQT